MDDFFAILAKLASEGVLITPSLPFALNLASSLVGLR